MSLVTSETAIDVDTVETDESIYVWPAVTYISTFGNPYLWMIVIIGCKVKSELQVVDSIVP